MADREPFDNSLSRQRKMTEKGMTYQIGIQTKHYYSAVSRLNNYMRKIKTQLDGKTCLEQHEKVDMLVDLQKYFHELKQTTESLKNLAPDFTEDDDVTTLRSSVQLSINHLTQATTNTSYNPSNTNTKRIASHESSDESESEFSDHASSTGGSLNGEMSDRETDIVKQNQGKDTKNYKHKTGINAESNVHHTNKPDLDREPEPYNFTLEDIKRSFADAFYPVSQQVCSISSRVDLVSSQVDSVKSDINSRVDSVKSDINSQVDSVKSEINSRVDSVSSQVDSVKSEINSRVDSVSSQVDSVKSDINSRVDSVSSQVDSVKSDINSRVDFVRSDIILKVDSVKSDIISVQSDVDSIKSDVDSIKSDMNRKIDDMSFNFDIRLDKVYTDVKEDIIGVEDRLKTSVESTKMEVNSEMKRIKSEMSKMVHSVEERIDVLSGEQTNFEKRVQENLNNFEKRITEFSLKSSKYTTFSEIASKKKDDLPAAAKSFYLHDIENDLLNTHMNHPSPITSPSNSQDSIRESNPPQGETSQSSSEIGDFAQVMCRFLKQSRIAPPTPQIFKGDPATYTVWRRSMSHLLDQDISESERLTYLQQFLSADIQNEFKTYLMDPSVASSKKVLEKLDKQYGDTYSLVKSYRDDLENWPYIKPRDHKSLRQFSNFLSQMADIESTSDRFNFLNEGQFIRNLCDKLPESLASQYVRISGKYKKQHRVYPPFSFFAEFIETESGYKNDPFWEGPRAPNPANNSVQKSTVKRNATTHSTETITPETLFDDTYNKIAQSLATNIAFQAEVAKKVTKKPNHFNSIQNQGRDQSTKMCSNCLKPGHLIDQCHQFKRLNPEERVARAVDLRLCILCLQPDHIVRKCEKGSSCEYCNRRHHSILHHENCLDQFDNVFRQISEKMLSAAKTNEPLREEKETRATAVNRVTFKTGIKKSVALTTMIIPVYLSSVEDPGREVLCYAMLDQQSDASYVRADIASNLKSKSRPALLNITTVTHIGHKVESRAYQGLQIRGLNNEQRIKLSELYTRDGLDVNPDRIPTKETAQSIPHLRHLAESFPAKMDIPVGLLIGYDNHEVLKIIKVENGPLYQPYAQLTQVGWGIIGSHSQMQCFDSIGNSHFIETEEHDSNYLHVFKTEVRETALHDLVQLMNKDVQDVGDGQMSQEDELFSRILSSGIHLNDEGHFQMPLPLKPDVSLPDNRFMAFRRLMSLKRQLSRKPHYHEHYKSFMNEILSRKDVEIVPQNEVESDTRWYLPHHGVYHPKKPDKLRVVFDCSARHLGKSLNDYLLQGPDMLNSLIGVLCRFRLHDVAFCCDIEKMFHAFHVDPVNRDYLRFLWWKDGDINSEPTDYRMRVHLFGATSSPGCANYGLKHVADHYRHLNNDASNFLRDDFYVDDGLRSSPTVQEAVNTLKGAREICSKGNLRLHKISSNSQELLAKFPPTELSSSKQANLSTGASPMERTLGIQWDTTQDAFNFSVEEQEKPYTRRGLLSVIASLYDPLGFISPFILKGKQILQETCIENIEWDQPINAELVESWEAWLSDLSMLPLITIPRCYTPKGFDVPTVREVHHFSDASEKGYGSCSYLRSVGPTQVHCALIMSKARVAPKKKVTIPRLELQAAVLSAKTARFVQKELDIPVNQHFFWSDSKVVIGYIQNESRRFHTYVANRVQQICEVSSSDRWCYVDTKQNPADHASRGLSVQAMIDSNWYKGPAFLWQPQISRNVEQYPLENEDREVRTQVHTLATGSKKDPENPKSMEQSISRMSSLDKVQAVFGRIVSLSRRKKGNPVSDFESRQIALSAIVKKIQEEYLYNPTKHVANQLRQLDARKNEEALLVVGGRIENSSHSRKITNPVILPKESHLSVLISRKAHQKVNHQGRTGTIHEIRKRGFWIIGMRSIVSKEIKFCKTCSRQRGTTLKQKMADLPSDRLERAPPFTFCGMDCFGPFYVKVNRSDVKRFVLLVTCLASRAVHTEMLEDMSSNAFINAFRRVIAIRGNIRLLRCDRGTNFVGANRELKDAAKEICNDDIAKRLLQFDCEFQFNPPAASHFGGVWERQIRSIRCALFGLLQDQKRPLTDMEFQTFLREATAVVNGRPLTVDSLDDPTCIPLSPNQILTMKEESVLPPPGVFQPADMYTRQRWRTVQYLADEFWNRWVKEYLSEQQKRVKWNKAERNVCVGDLVWLSSDMQHRSSWPLARIVEANPDCDGLVRKVKIQMTNSDLSSRGVARAPAQVLERPIHKLVLFIPVENQ